MRSYRNDPSSPQRVRLDEDTPDPVPAPDEAVIVVEAFALNRGELLGLSVRDPGWRPGRDVAGTVLTAAADGSGPAAGSRVVAIVEGGSWAERVAAPTDQVAALPDEVSTIEAAALPTAGLTALRGLREGGSVVGERVLVTAATGAVGGFAIQLARVAGAEVTALVNRADSTAEATVLGADHVVTDLEDGPARYHLALDGAGGDVLRALLAHLAPHGVVATYGAMAGPATLSFADLHTTVNPRIVGLVHAEPPERRGADLVVLTRLVRTGAVVPRVGLVDDWTRTDQALDAMARGQVRGRVVMTVGRPDRGQLPACH